MSYVWLLEDYLSLIRHLPGRWVLWEGVGSFLSQSPTDKRISQIPLFSACVVAFWSKLLLCLLLLPVVLVLHFPLCSAFSARLKIFINSGQALSSAGCALQGQIGHRYSNKYKATLLKSNLMQRLGGRELYLAQGRRNLGRWKQFGAA